MDTPNSLGFLWNRRESVALCFLIVTVVLWVAAARLEILPWFTRMEKRGNTMRSMSFLNLHLVSFLFCTSLHTSRGEWVSPLGFNFTFYQMLPPSQMSCSYHILEYLFSFKFSAEQKSDLKEYKSLYWALKLYLFWVKAP